MSDAKISALPSAATLTGAERLPVSQSNQTRGATAAQLLSSSLFTQTGTGAVARSINSKFGDIVSVKDFGAIGDGVTDDTAAWAAVALIGGNIRAPKGTYLITDTVLFALARTNIIGDGQQSTIIKFAPTTTGKAAFHFKLAAASAIAQCSLRGVAFDATGNTQGTKSAVRVTDGEEFILDDIAVSNWTSGATDCIGLQFRGRQTHSVSNVTISADLPISIEDNPNSVIDIDQFHFWNCYLLATSNPCIAVATGVILSNVVFDGYQSWVGGTHGFFWNDTTSAAISINLTIKNARTEQGTSATAYMVSITHNFALQNLVLENMYGGADRRGFFFRKVQFWEIRNCVYTSTTAEALNIDSTTQYGKGSNNFWQTGATATISGLTRLYQWGAAVNTSLATEFLYLNTSTYAAVSAVFGTSLSTPSPRTGTNATDTITNADSSFIANRAGTITLTLQSASSVPGRELTIRTIQAQTVVSAASDVVPLVGGAAGTAILAATAGKWALLKSDGTNWQIMAGN